MIKPILIPTNNPGGSLLGFGNLLTASTTDDAEKALIPNTFERWRPPSGAVTVKFQMSVTAEIDFIGIAAHALTGESFVLSTAATVGGALTERAAASPTDNGALMFSFDPVTVQEIAFTATLSAANEIGVIFAGKALQMPRNIYGGHSPITLSQVTEFQSPVSETGQFLSRNIIRQGLKTTMSWQFLDPDFYRNDFQLFVNSVRKNPFFVKWRPDLFSNEVAFCQTIGDIKPTNMGGGHTLMSVSAPIIAHADL